MFASPRAARRVALTRPVPRAAALKYAAPTMPHRSTYALVFACLAAVASSSCGAACTEVGCTSTLRIRLEHSLALADGPYLLEVTTPAHELRCSFGPETTGDRTCFGFRFADLDWDESAVTLLLTEPFEGGAVFEAVDVRVSREGAPLFEQTIAVDAGPLLEPNGPGCPPVCVEALALGSLGG